MTLRNVFIMAALAASLRAQTRTQFEVASIKPSGAADDQHCEGGGVSPGRLAIPCATLRELIQYAYGFYANGMTMAPRQLQILGAPAWTDSRHYDLEATAENHERGEMMAGPMLQALLEDRFHLKVHRETREQPVYSLTIAKSGLKTEPLREACIPRDVLAEEERPAPGQKPPNFCNIVRMRSNGRDMTFDGHAMTMADLAASLGLDRKVIDKTGIAGIFDFHLEFALDGTTPGTPFGRGPAFAQPDNASPSIFTAIQELGLRLESDKGPVEFLVIDHVEKPSEN
jgi:uncharacterized protein (TIGR03435 family)